MYYKVLKSHYGKYISDIFWHCLTFSGRMTGIPAQNVFLHGRMTGIHASLCVARLRSCMDTPSVRSCSELVHRLLTVCQKCDLALSVALKGLVVQEQHMWPIILEEVCKHDLGRPELFFAPLITHQLFCFCFPHSLSAIASRKEECIVG